MNDHTDPNATDAPAFDLKALLDAAQSEAVRIGELLLGGAVDDATGDEPAHDKDGA